MSGFWSKSGPKRHQTNIKNLCRNVIENIHRKNTENTSNVDAKMESKSINNPSKIDPRSMSKNERPKINKIRALERPRAEKGAPGIDSQGARWSQWHQGDLARASIETIKTTKHNTGWSHTLLAKARRILTLSC